MAFRDQNVVMYDGSILVQYKDKPHTYYVRERIDFNLPTTDMAAWSKKARRPKGTTTLLGDTLEKKGLQLWPMGLALTELFGFYDFTNEKGERMTGFSKKNGGGTLWGLEMSEDNKEQILEAVLSASKAHTRRMKQGADVGSLVHEAIENFITGREYGHILTVEYYERGQLWFDVLPDLTVEQQAERTAWLLLAPEELKMAQLAFDAFFEWWNRTQPEVVAAEQIVYSKEHDVSGAFDGLLKIKPEHHPVFSDWKRPILVMEDHKTTKASVPAGAPEGVYYSYFAQDAAYAKAYYEMTGVMVDDLLVVSTRKDGGFTPIYLSELGLTVADAIAYWDAIVLCCRTMDKLKFALVKHAEPEVSNVV